MTEKKSNMTTTSQMDLKSYNYQVEEEKNLKWVIAPQKYAYLRESIAPCKTIDGARDILSAIPYADAHIVGYVTLVPTATRREGHYQRRYWWARSFDRFHGSTTCAYYSFYSDPNSAPAHSVCIKSIKAQKPSAEWTPQTNNNISEFKDASAMSCEELEF